MRAESVLLLHSALRTHINIRLEKLFASPNKFIASIVNASVVYGFDGVNLDFEPRWKATVTLLILCSPRKN